MVKRMGEDDRCEVHQMVLSIREEKEGWFHFCSPSSPSCFDDGQLWALMVGLFLGLVQTYKACFSHYGHLTMSVS